MNKSNPNPNNYRYIYTQLLRQFKPNFSPLHEIRGGGGKISSFFSIFHAFQK